MHAASRDPRYRVDFAIGIRVCEINRATFGRGDWAEWEIFRSRAIAIPSRSINRPEVTRAELATISRLLTPFPSSALNPHDR